ncbi:MAG: pilus assembly protein [Kiritimatiellae bacterium]|nr:pilus assembly protein [Kiritimatiellia bacterium]
MSRIIDMSDAVRSGREGSIMVEFLLVLPIYMLLIGMLILWGDMGLKAIVLAFGDRCVAFDGTDREGYSYSQFSSIEIIKDGLSGKTRKAYRVDRNVKGPWSAQYAGRISYDYKMYSWINGIVGYPLVHYGNASPGIIETLVGGGIVPLDGKGLERVRMYNCYTLRRTEQARDPAVCRNWDADALLGLSDGKRGWEWSRDELYADSSAENLESSHSLSDDALPNPTSLGRYKRYDAYDGWTE